MKRTKPIRKYNPIRRKRLRDEAFGEQAERCRGMKCCCCDGFPTVPHHEPPRRYGNTGGKDRDTVPLCAHCHVTRHIKGRKALEEEHGVDLDAVKERMRDD